MNICNKTKKNIFSHALHYHFRTIYLSLIPVTINLKLIKKVLKIPLKTALHEISKITLTPDVCVVR